MTIKKGGAPVFFIILFLLSFESQTCYTQERQLPLFSILNQLEERFDVRFSYASQDIENTNVPAPDYESSLLSILDELNRITKLHFKFIDERYIVITKTADYYFDLCGIILNEETLLPLDGASIQVEGANQAAISDSQGGFTITNVQQSIYLEIRHIGFETLHVPAVTLKEANPCTTLTLKPQVNRLEDVVIQSIFTKGINKDKSGSVTMQVETFGNLPGLTEPDVLLMIQSLPGVSSADETVSNINIRGGTTDENLILWDDIRMFQNGHFFGLISGFNPYITKDVTLFKSGTHARYGESVSGVIAMRSSDHFPEKTTGGIQMNLINLGAFVKVSVSEKLGIHLSGRRSVTDFMKTATYNQFFQRIFQNTEITNLQNISESGTLTAEEDFMFYDLNLKAIYKATDNNMIRFNFLNIDNALNFTETFSTQTSQTSKTSELDQKSLAGGIGWDREWQENLSTSALIYSTYYILDASNLDVFSNQQLIQINEVLENGLKLQTSLDWKNNNTFTAGYQFTETGISNTQDVNIPRFRNYVKEVLRNHALFVSNSFDFPASNTRITAGIRTNYFPKFDKLLIEPRINAHQKLGNGFALEASFEQKSQTVTQRIDLQSDFLGVEKRRWVLANDKDVPILTSNQYALGFSYQKNNWLLQTEGFLKKVDGITTANQGFQNQLQFVRSIGHYDATGLEFILNKKSKNWSAWLSYTYTNIDYNFDRLSPEVFPHNSGIPHQATLAATYNIQDFKFAAGLNWHSGKPYTVPQQENAVQTINGTPTIQYESPNGERLEDYFRADISATYEFVFSRKVTGKIHAAVLNVSDKRNVLNRYYVIEDPNAPEPVINQIEQISLGLTPNFSLQLLF